MTSLKWLLLLAFLSLLAYWVYQINIYVYVRYRRHEQDDHFFLRVYALRGLFSYDVKVPVAEVDWQDEMVWFESELKETQGNKRIQTVFERHVVKKVVDFICYHPRRFRHILQSMEKTVRQARVVIRELQAKVRCDQFICQIHFGLEDAALTGIIAGVLWSVRGLALAALRSRMSFGTCPVCLITPVFGQDILRVELECILRIRLGNLINALRNADKQGGMDHG